ncbi:MULTISPECIES: RHS repeat domain-containing protein [unclassified Endozoicomonas]|uniref:RHS repeat domain-containing protein n=1 Tax=unclassified Endozoicomonas TaxID=2644528 RepID=UPI003BB5E613
MNSVLSQCAWHPYRANNLLTSSSDPRGIETTYQHDTAKRLLQVDAQGKVIR